MNKRAIQIDVIGKVEGTQFMKCKLYTNENIVIIMMNEFDYERLKKEGIFIRDGKSRDSAGVLRGDSPGCGSILIAFGEDNAEVIKTCDIAGKYVRIN